MALITLGANSGKGKILQVVEGNSIGSSVDTTSTSYVDSGLHVQITPSSTSSKIIIFYTGIIVATATNTEVLTALYKDDVSLAESRSAGYNASGGFTTVTGTFDYIDSPSSTAQIEYELYFRRNGLNNAVRINATSSKMYAMEIQG